MNVFAYIQKWPNVTGDDIATLDFFFCLLSVYNYICASNVLASHTPDICACNNNIQHLVVVTFVAVDALHLFIHCVLLRIDLKRLSDFLLDSNSWPRCPRIIFIPYVNCRKCVILGAFFKCPTQRLKDAYMGNLTDVGNTRSKASVCKALIIAYLDGNVNNESLRTFCESCHHALANICNSQVRM